MQPSRRRSVVDVALQGGTVMTTLKVDRAKVLQRLRLGDIFYHQLTRAAAITVLIILGGIIISLVHGSWLALKTFGLNFLITRHRDPVAEKIGALPPIEG